MTERVEGISFSIEKDSELSDGMTMKTLLSKNANPLSEIAGEFNEFGKSL